MERDLNKFCMCLNVLICHDLLSTLTYILESNKNMVC